MALPRKCGNSRTRSMRRDARLFHHSRSIFVVPIFQEAKPMKNLWLFTIMSMILLPACSKSDEQGALQKSSPAAGAVSDTPIIAEKKTQSAGYMNVALDDA